MNRPAVEVFSSMSLKLSFRTKPVFREKQKYSDAKEQNRAELHGRTNIVIAVA